jgi:uncharacterized membrane protein YeiH
VITLPTLAHGLDLLGVAVFAASGALSAARRGLDLLGVLVIAGVTALGGGTLRDLLLDRHPLFWITNPAYLPVCALAALATLGWIHSRPVPERGLQVADALGLALFTIMGTRIAAGMGLAAVPSVLMGAVTGVAGGLLRDVLCNEVPLVLRRDLYAIPAIAGSSVYLATGGLGLAAPLTIWLGLATVVTLRLLAVFRGWSLPDLSIRGNP